MATIIFESADGERFTVPLQLTTYSTTIKTMLDNLEVDDTGSEVIPMPNIVSPILKKVLEWAKHEQVTQFDKMHCLKLADNML